MRCVKNPRVGTGVSNVLVAGPTPPSLINRNNAKDYSNKPVALGSKRAVMLSLTAAPFLRYTRALMVSNPVSRQ